MFGMVGKIVKLFRYKIDYIYTLQDMADNGKITEKKINQTEYCTSEQEKDAFIASLQDKKPKITAIDQTDNEWIDGLEFESYNEAILALSAGKSNYKPTISNAERIDNLEKENEIIAKAFEELANLVLGG